MKRLLGTAIALALAAPLFAFANDAYIVSDISLQSGPDQEYPPIGDLQAGTEVDVQGCIEGYSWCDVIVGGDRGWVPGSFVEEEYNNQPVYLVDYGPRIGLPIVTFSIGTYWDSHYHNRPFYSQRTEWVNRHFTPRQPPRPSIAHAPPIPNRGGPNHGESNHGGQSHGPDHGTPSHDVAHTNAPNHAPVPVRAPPHPMASTHTDHPPTATHTDNVHRTTTTTTQQRVTTTQHPQTATQPNRVEHPPQPKPETRKAPPPKTESHAPAEHKDDDHGH